MHLTYHILYSSQSTVGVCREHVRLARGSFSQHMLALLPPFLFSPAWLSLDSPRWSLINFQMILACTSITPQRSPARPSDIPASKGMLESVVSFSITPWQKAHWHYYGILSNDQCAILPFSSCFLPYKVFKASFHLEITNKVCLKYCEEDVLQLS